jgi:hypothetical protein
MDAGGASTGYDARFDVLLRDLLSLGLVERRNGELLWQLSSPAQRRLESLACPRPPADKVVYFGHHCGACHELRPTRFRFGRYLCDPCLEGGEWLTDDPPATDGASEYPAPPPPPIRHPLAPVVTRGVRVLELNGFSGSAIDPRTADGSG